MTRILIFALVLQISPSIAQDDRSLSMDSLLQSYAFHGRFNGTVIVSTSDGMLYHRTISKQVKNSEEPVYGVMSLSKQYTAVAILKLAEQGKLRMDDFLIDYLPEYVPKKGRKITLHHLLSQSSGLIDNFARPTEDPDDVILPRPEPIELDGLLRKLFVNDMHSKPGKKFSYSNLNYVLLAGVIEKVSGMSYAHYMEKEIFVPANLTSTFSEKNNVPVNRLAKPYEGQRQGVMRSCKSYDESWLTGAGSIYSTASDLAKWIDVLEKNSLISSKSKDLLFAKHTHVNGKMYYGYGWMIDERDREEFVWHDGTYEGYSSYLGWFPKKSSRIVIAANHTNKLEELDQSEELVKELSNKLLILAVGKRTTNLPFSAFQNKSMLGKQQHFKLDDKHSFVLSDLGDSIEMNTATWSLFEYPYLLSIEGETESRIKAEKFCNYFIKGKYGKAKRLGTVGIRMFPAALYKGFWKGKTEDAGAFVDFNIFKVKEYEESVTYSIRFNYELKQFGLIVSVNTKNKIQGFFNHTIPEKSKRSVVKGVRISDTDYFVDGFRYDTHDVVMRSLKSGNLSFCVGEQCYEASLVK